MRDCTDHEGCPEDGPDCKKHNLCILKPGPDGERHVPAYRTSGPFDPAIFPEIITAPGNRRRDLLTAALAGAVGAALVEVVTAVVT